MFTLFDIQCIISYLHNYILTTSTYVNIDSCVLLPISITNLNPKSSFLIKALELEIGY